MARGKKQVSGKPKSKAGDKRTADAAGNEDDFLAPAADRSRRCLKTQAQTIRVAFAEHNAHASARQSQWRAECVELPAPKYA